MVSSTRRQDPVTLLLRSYGLIAAGTVLAVAVLAKAAPHLAPDAAWWHAIIVLIFAVLLLARWQRARGGNRGAVRAVGVIATVLLIANGVEAFLSEFPGWMRVEMVGIAVLMLACLLLLRGADGSTAAGD